jgi:ABC-type uncharacterized transport system substrate-binding protein
MAGASAAGSLVPSRSVKIEARRASLVGFLVLAAPLTTEAQRAGRAPRIGALMDGSFESRRTFLDAFRQGLRDVGYTEGQNIVIESRFVEGGDKRLHDVAVELVHLNVDVIVTSGVPGARAAKRATATIPIVVAAASDFVGPASWRASRIQAATSRGRTP